MLFFLFFLSLFLLNILSLRNLKICRFDFGHCMKMLMLIFLQSYCLGNFHFCLLIFLNKVLNHSEQNSHCLNLLFELNKSDIKSTKAYNFYFHYTITIQLMIMYFSNLRKN